MDALELESRPVTAKAAEDVGKIDQPLHQPGREVVTARHDFPGQGPGGETLPHVLEVARLHEPGLVGQHVKAGVVEPPDRTRLAAVPPGQHHHVAAPLSHETRERLAGREHGWPPARGLFGSPIEPLHQRKEIAKLDTIRRVDEDLVPDSGMRDAQGQRRVKVPGIEKEQGVHVSTAAWPSPFRRSA